MKNNKILKAFSIITMAIMLFAMLAFPIGAETTANPQIQMNPDFDANQTIRAVVNWIIGILVIIGACAGGFHIVMGQINQDTKERNGGIIGILIALAAGGLILIIINNILK